MTGLKNFSLINKVGGRLPVVLPFLNTLKTEILGEKYDLSIALVNPSEIKKINGQYRHKNQPTDILSFELSKNQGEIFICPSVAKKKAPLFNRSYKNFFSFLFIHGLCHLKGMTHGSKMESEERKYRAKFKI